MPSTLVCAAPLLRALLCSVLVLGCDGGSPGALPEDSGTGAHDSGPTACELTECSADQLSACDGSFRVDCTRFGGGCVDAAFAVDDRVIDASWCSCGAIPNGGATCIGQDLVACRDDILELSRCPPGTTCAADELGCYCDERADGICPGAVCSGDPDCVACVPSCAGRQCGGDGCGGSCGSCAALESCVAGTCSRDCAPSCSAASCGDDGCGGSCGSCPAGVPCVAGSCSCTPSCSDRECGSDGCGGTCGHGCAPGDVCRFGRCSPSCAPLGSVGVCNTIVGVPCCTSGALCDSAEGYRCCLPFGASCTVDADCCSTGSAAGYRWGCVDSAGGRICDAEAL